jgi:hypothetical protein
MSFEILIFRNGQPDCDDDPQGKRANVYLEVRKRRGHIFF